MLQFLLHQQVYPTWMGSILYKISFQILFQISENLKKLHSNELIILNKKTQMVCLAFLLLND